jgi:putative methionine-R-sulfoxide reductase with GAF domain
MTPLGELGKNYRDGEVVFREGDEGGAMFVIQEGRVRVSRSTERGEVSIATLGPGDIFGEVALFEEGVHSATVTVLGEARILTVDKARFFKGMCRDPSLAFNLLKTMSDRIRNIDREFIGLKNRTLEIMEWGMDLEETCHVILEEARDEVQADNGSVMIADRDRGTLEIKAAFGTNTPSKAILAMGEGIAGHVVSTGSAEIINNVEADPRFKPGTLSISSIICVPLGTREERFGVINLSNASEERLFSRDDLKFIKSLSVYASVAVGNAFSLSEMKHATESLMSSVHRTGAGTDEDFNNGGVG